VTAAPLTQARILEPGLGAARVIVDPEVTVLMSNMPPSA
jgi:hypothetical protein